MTQPAVANQAGYALEVARGLALIPNLTGKGGWSWPSSQHVTLPLLPASQEVGAGISLPGAEAPR